MTTAVPVRFRRLAPAALTLGALWACNSDRAVKVDARSSLPRAADVAEVRAAASGKALLTGGAPSTPPSPAPMAGADPLRFPAQGDSTPAASMIIRTGNASLVVDSLELAVARVRALAARLGGYVANTAMQSGPEQLRSATLTLRIPSARYDEALGGLSPIGRIETVLTDAEDVGEEFVDVQARLANARRLEERLIGLLATRTGRLDDVLAVERELARVREQSERFEGRLRYLRARVALSTLAVTVHEPAPLLGSNPSANVIGGAFVAAWRNFLGFVAGMIAALGWLVPVALLAALAVAVARRIGAHRWWPPRRRHRTDEAPPASA